MFTFDSLEARVLVSQEPAVAEPKQDVSIVERTVCHAVDRLLVNERHNLELLDLLRLQVEHHDALTRHALLDEDLANEHDFRRVKHLLALAESLM